MKHMEEMKIAGLAMALCIVMLGIYIVVPKDGTVSHLTAIPDNNAAEPVTDSTSEGTADADFPIYTEDSYSSEPESSDDTGDGDSYTEEPTYDQVIILTTAIRIVKPMEQILQIHLQMEPMKTQAIMKIRTVAPVKWSMTMITVVLRIRILIAVRPKIPAVMALMI